MFEPKLAAVDSGYSIVVQLHCEPWDRGTGVERADARCRAALAEVMLLNESGLNSSILHA